MVLRHKGMIFGLAEGGKSTANGQQANKERIF